jgi:hypothetical protein
MPYAGFFMSVTLQFNYLFNKNINLQLMKIGSFTPNSDGTINDLRLMRPCQTLLIVPTPSSQPTLTGYLSNNYKINVTLQNSATGSQDTIIPFVGLTELAEISTFNEGATRLERTQVVYPVMLSPKGNVKLDSDKYLQIDLQGFQSVSNVDVYSFEADANIDFYIKYQKMSVPAGTSRYKANVLKNDIISMPTNGFDMFQVTYKTGIVATFTPLELRYQMARTNDLTAYRSSPDLATETSVVGSRTEADVIFGFGKSFVINLLNVDSIEVIRDTDSSANFEFILADLTA